MEYVGWAKSTITGSSLFKNGGIDLNKNGAVEKNELVRDVNGNGTCGDNEDFLAYLDQNGAILRKEIDFLDYGRGLRPDNRIHQLLYMESLLPGHDAGLIQKAYKQLTQLISGIREKLLAARYEDGLHLSMVQKIQLAYWYMKYQENYSLDSKADATFTESILSRSLDCDTSSLVILALADELKHEEAEFGKEWGRPGIIWLPGHAFVELDGVYIDKGVAGRTRDTYIGHFNLTPESGDTFFKPLQGEEVYALFYFNRGRAFADHQDYERAIQDYNRALQIMPGNDSVYTRRGLAYFELQDYNRAFDDFAEAVRINPRNKSAYYYLGEFCYHFDRKQKATEYYKLHFDSNYSNNKAIQGIRDVLGCFAGTSAEDSYVSYSELIRKEGKISDNADLFIGAIKRDRRIFDVIRDLEKEGHSELGPDALSLKDLYAMARGVSHDGLCLFKRIEPIVARIEKACSE